jgi:hypothetical protein
MDPNANLTEQRRIVAEIIAIQDSANDAGEITEASLDRQSELGVRLADLAEALDQWLAGGGFLPDAWNRGR